nr:hypothetical protein [Anaerolineae bacterium]
IKPVTEDVATPTQDDPDAWMKELGIEAVSPAEQEQALRKHTEQWVASIDPAAPAPVDPAADWLVAPVAPPAQDDDESWLAAFAEAEATVEAEPSSQPEDASASDPDWMRIIDDSANARTIVGRPDIAAMIKEHDRQQAEAQKQPPTPVENTDDPFDFSQFEPAADEPVSTSNVGGLTGLLSALSGGDEAEAQPAKAGLEPDADDPFAWMMQDEIEMIEPSNEVEEFLGDALGVNQMGSLDQGQEDALAWARNAGLDLTDDPQPASEEADLDPFAWMREDGIELIESAQAPQGDNQPQLLSSPPAPLPVTDADAWLPTPEPEAADTIEPEAAATGMTGLLAFMSSGDKAASTDLTGGDMPDNNDIPDWLRASTTGGDDDANDSGQPDSASDDLGWLSDMDAPAAATTPPPADDLPPSGVPEWLAAGDDDERDPNEFVKLSTVEMQGLTLDEEESGLYATLDEAAPLAGAETLILDPPMPAAEDEAAPEWASLPPVDEVAIRTPAAEKTVMPSVTYDPHDDLLLMAAEPALTSEAAPAPVEDDWLSALAANAPTAPESEAPIAEVFGTTEAPSVEQPSYDFLSDDSAPEGDSLDFLLSDESLDSTDDPYGFLKEDAPASADDLFGAPAAQPSDSLDFLNDPAPVASDAPASYDFLADDADDLFGAPAAQPSDSLDFLNDPAPVANDAPASYDFLADDADDLFGAPAAQPSDSLDFLNDPAPVASDAPNQDDLFALFDAPATPTADADADAFSLDFFDEAETTGSQTGLLADPDPAPAESDSAFEFAMLGAAVVGGSPATDTQPDGMMAVLDGEPNESLSETAALSAPDWLNALAPGLEVDTEAPDLTTDGEYLGAGRGEYGWLSALVDEELRPPVLSMARREPRFPFSKPPHWLQSIREETQQISPLPADSDDGLPDWLRGLDEPK